MSYAMLAIITALIAANIATAYQLWRTMRQLSDELVALAQSDADLATARGNEAVAISAANDAAELANALRATNANDRKVEADAKDVEIETATPEKLIALGNRQLQDPFDAPASDGASTSPATVPVVGASAATKIKSNFRR